jgi:hypothetical protein
VPANQCLVRIHPDIQATTDITTGLAHDLFCRLDLLPVVHLQQDRIMDQHNRDDPGIAQTHGGQPQHFGAVTLHREIEQGARVRI